MKPSVSDAPQLGKPFLIYVRVMDHALYALLAQTNDEGHEQTIYYLSLTMIGAEHRYCEEKVFGYCLGCPESASLLEQSDDSHHIKGQSFADPYNTTFCV